MSTSSPEIATYLFEHARDILLVIDASTGNIIDANPAAELAYGWTRDELVTRTIFELRVADPEPVTEQMRRARAQGTLFETVHRRRDGSTFAVEVNSRGVDLHDRQVLLSVVRDITIRKRLEREREALMETTRRALEQRDEFLVMASHELRGPVTNVSLALQQLRRVLERDGASEGACGAVTSSLAEVSRLATLIDTLLDAQSARGDIVLAPSPTNLRELAHGLIERLRPRAALAGSELVIDVPDLVGHWDRLRLDQVLTNLLVNAIKYGRGQRVLLTAKRVDDGVCIEVCDRGIGIREEDRARIFEKFERAVSASFGGLGLGLYITRQIVETHGGTIEVTSKPDEGSTFTVRLPLAVPA